MRKYKNVIVIALIMSFLFVQVTPRRAEAIIPGIAAAAAAVGCSEGTLVAVGAALLTAGGIVVAGENEKVKAVSAAVAGLGSAALERLSAAVNAVGPGGEFTLPIDQYMAQDIADMVQNVNDVAESGEGIETKFAGPETMLHPLFGQSLTGEAGILSAWYEWYGNTYYGGHIYLCVNRVNSSENTGIIIAEEFNGYTGDYEIRYRIKTGGYMVGNWTTIYVGKGPLVYEGTVSVVVDEENSYAFVDGELVYTWEGGGSISGWGLDWIDADGNNNTSVVYSIDAMGEDVLTPGVDYTDAQLTPEQIAALAGTTINGNVVTNVYNPPVINPPVTWPATPDLTGILEALKNLWNSIIQGFAGLGAKVVAIPAAIALALQGNPGETINWEPIKSVGTGLTTAFPFSLPWDVQRIFSSLNGAEWNGVAEINVEGVLAKFDFDINIEQWFGGVRPIVKTAEVICFDLALILATRKLLGGAQ